MTADLQSLKAVTDCRDLARETGGLDRDNKRLCLFHDEKTPSLQFYKDGYHCFGCGAHGDAVDWLEAVHALSTAEAIKELERRAGGYIPPAAERPVKVKKPQPTFKPIDAKILEAHRRRAAQLDRVPLAMLRRGFTLDDLQRLGFAAYGGDAVFLIPGPDGAVLALKRRYAEPRGGQRYRYATPGHGCPAWCSPDFRKSEVLIIEGELNALSCWLACPELSVMGAAGTNGALHLDALAGRTVYIYADADAVGQAARDRWAKQALSAGATKVFTLEAWPLDACDLGGTQGRAALRERLTGSLEAAKSFDPAFTEQPPFDEHGSSSNKSPWLSQKSHLTNTSRTQIGTGWANAKSPWGH